MIRPLEDRFGSILMAKPLEGGYKTGDDSVCRGRRPRRPARIRTINHQNKMDVIWHNYIFIYVDIANFIARKKTFFCNMTHRGQPDLRGVEGAAPYNTSEYILLSFRADRNEIRTGGAVIKTV